MTITAVLSGMKLTAAIGSGTITINGAGYTVAQLQDSTIYTASMASALLQYHREHCIWYNNCQKWIQVQNASLYLTTTIMNTQWPASTPATGTIFAEPYLSTFDHANAVFGSLSTLQSQVVNYGTNNNYPSDTYCMTPWPPITSGSLYEVCEALGNRLASQQACLGLPMTTDEIELLKKQLFLGFYLNIKWQMVKQYAGCTFYDDNNAIFLIPPASIGSMQSIIDNALAATINQKSCHEKAIDNVNIWMGALSSGCLSTLGISFTAMTDYTTGLALSLQTAYSSTSTSGGLVQLFYNYSRAVCEATTASTPVNPNVLGMFYDPDPDNTITDAPGEVQYDAIKTLLATSGCNYSTTANLPFEVYPPASVTAPAPGLQTSQQNLTIALNALAETVITGVGCTTCTEQTLYRNVAPFDAQWIVRTVNNISLPNGLSGSARYIYPVGNHSDYFQGTWSYPCVMYSNILGEPEHYFQFEITDLTCKFYNKDLDSL